MSTRPLASLSSGLLARPGAAKPAMRPQSLNGFTHAEDLGWNDMGHAPVTIAAVPPAPAPQPVPPVLAERAKLARAVKPAAAAEPSGRKAAFTLRLDADRHLRLRLASAVAGRSSQQLLITALDAFLDAQPQVEALARQVPATKQRSTGEKK